MDEIWKPVVGHPGYDVSSKGNVRSWSKLKRGDLMKLRTNRDGYLYVMFGTKVRKVHHLVLEAFVGLRPKGFMCLHGDDDKTNNCLSNLSWDTRAQNNTDAWRRRLNRGRSKLKDWEVVFIRRCNLTSRALARIFTVDPSVISTVRSRKVYRNVP